MTAPAPTFDDLYNAAYNELLTRNPDIAVITGDVTDAMLCAIAAGCDAAVRQSVSEVRATFWDGSSGDDLVRVITDAINLPKLPAVAAVGDVTFTRASSANGAHVYPVGFKVGSAPDASGKQVVVALTQQASFGALEVGSKTVAVQATVTGGDGNAAPGALDQFVDANPDANVTVSNADRISGGEPEEDDDSYKKRGRDFYSTLRRATLAALEFGAKTVALVRNAKSSEDASFQVTLYVADDDGASNLEMVAAVQAALLDWRAAGIPVTVLGGQVLTVDVTYSLVVEDGVDPTQLEPDIEAAMRARTKKRRAGETLYLEELRFAAKGVDPDGVPSVTISAPAADVVPAVNQVIRLGSISRV